MSGAPSPRYNLAVRRGTSNVIFSYTDRHSLVLAEPVPAGTIAVPVTQVYVQSVPVQIETATVLEFKPEPSSCTVYRLTTNGVTLVGAKAIAIQPYIGRAIPCHWVADAGPVDLTGRVYQAQVKKKDTDPAPYITLNCRTEPLAGLVEISCTTTGTEDFNAKFTDLPTTAEELQTLNATHPDTGALLHPRYKKIIEAAWFWDLEYKLGAKTIPEYVGLFWLQAEATVQP